MSEPTIRRDAIDLTGCTDAERAAILAADRVWIETLPANDGTTHGVFVRVVDAMTFWEFLDRIDTLTGGKPRRTDA